MQSEDSNNKVKPNSGDVTVEISVNIMLDYETVIIVINILET